MAYQTILYEKANRIARITLNRPEKLNALSTQLRFEVMDAIKKAGDDDEVNVVVIKGAGRAFCAGYDISAQPAAGGTDEYMQRRRQRTIRQDIDGMMDTIVEPWSAVKNSRKPTIAQIHGYCLAGATDLAFLCDMIVCAEDAVFGCPPVRAMGGPPTHMWTYLMGPQWAKYMLFTGNSIDGKTAERIGLAWKAVPAAQLEEEVNQLAETISKVPYGLLSVHKRIVNMALDLMGRTLLQPLACEGDAIAHLDPAAIEFGRISATKGHKAALDWRDSQFGDYRAATTKAPGAGEKKK